MNIKKILPFLFLFAVLAALSACQNQRDTAPVMLTEPTLAETTTEEPETKKEPDRSAEYIYKMYPEFTSVDYDSPALLPESEPMDEDYIKDAVFLCDSTLYWLKRDLVSPEQIWTGKEYTQTLAFQSTFKILDPYDNIERPIREVVELHKPKRMIITLGINGLSFMSYDEVREEYLDLVTDIKEISPKTDLILQSILPMNRDMFRWSNADVNNEKITRANSIILDIAEETGCKYLDTFSVFIGEDGYAKKELFKDGLHPTDAGLQLIIDYINNHGHVE